ncbi:MAG TPA: hypothetical protein VMN37_05030, partial [Gemmatimonadales bacterium]|nr:hypothetical protein [Gemmatimonadales bacterium]
GRAQVGPLRFLDDRQHHVRLPADADLLGRARELAGRLIAADPALQRAEHQRLRQRAVSRYPRAVELFRVG